MGFSDPTEDELEQVANNVPFKISSEELSSYRILVSGVIEEIERIQEIPEPQFSPNEYSSGRRGGYRPDPKNNPHNIWIRKCNIGGKDTGLMSGWNVGLKDNISLAGIKMTCGSRMMEGYIPDIDATVVDRILDEGASIRGKLNMETFGYSASSDLTDYGTVSNPHNEGHSVGGSSSGPAAAVAIDKVDLALGTDQGGSIRIPAAWSGIVGCKATHGLIPYTGVFPIDMTLDHVGPLASSVEKIAIALEVLAGPDGLDHRQNYQSDSKNYIDSVSNGVNNVTVGVLEEGFNNDVADPQICEAVMESLNDFCSANGSKESVSVSLHSEALPLEFAILGYGGMQLFDQGGNGTFHESFYDTNLIREFSYFCQERAEELPPTVKASWLASAYVHQNVRGELYGKAQNITRQMEQEYNSLLQQVDVLAMPTVPFQPFELNPQMKWDERVSRSLQPAVNTVPFNMTGHPAITVPCGTVDQNPVGIMFVADHFDEKTLLNVASAFESKLS